MLPECKQIVRLTAVLNRTDGPPLRPQLRHSLQHIKPDSDWDEYSPPLCPAGGRVTHASGHHATGMDPAKTTHRAAIGRGVPAYYECPIQAAGHTGRLLQKCFPMGASGSTSHMHSHDLKSLPTVACFPSELHINQFSV